MAAIPSDRRLVATTERPGKIAVAAVLVLFSGLGWAGKPQWSRVPQDARLSLEGMRSCLARERVVPGAMERRCGAFVPLSQKRYDEVNACMAPARLIDYKELRFAGAGNHDGQAIAQYQCEDWTLIVDFDLHGRRFEAKSVGELVSD